MAIVQVIISDHDIDIPLTELVGIIRERLEYGPMDGHNRYFAHYLEVQASSPRQAKRMPRRNEDGRIDLAMPAAAVIDFETDPPNDVVGNMIATGDLLDPAALERLGWAPHRLRKALAAQRVFFVERDGIQYFPAFFADPRYDSRQLGDVNKALGDLDGLSKLLWFRTPKGSLNGATPLQALLAGSMLTKVKNSAAAYAGG